MTEAVLTDWRTAPISDRLRATLGFLQKVTLTPDALGPADLALLHQAGLSDQAVEDALYVALCFTIITRVADALGFEVPAPASLAAAAPRMLQHGYGRFVVTDEDM